MKAKKAANKLLSILLLCAMLLTLLSGCGAEEEVSENSAENEQNAQSTQSSA